MTDQPALRVVDALGHDLPVPTSHVLHAMIAWLDLEELAGELTPGLRDLRDMLREQAAEADD